MQANGTDHCLSYLLKPVLSFSHFGKKKKKNELALLLEFFFFLLHKCSPTQAHNANFLYLRPSASEVIKSIQVLHKTFFPFADCSNNLRTSHCAVHCLRCRGQILSTPSSCSLTHDFHQDSPAAGYQFRRQLSTQTQPNSIWLL